MDTTHSHPAMRNNYAQSDTAQPVAAQSRGMYILYDTMIEGRPCPDGSFSHVIFLEGRQLSDKAKYIGGVEDETVLELLRSSSGLHQLVHSIGVSIQALDEQDTVVRFTLQHWGKTDRHSGTQMTADCPADGSQTRLILDEYECSPDDDAPGLFRFAFEREGALARVHLVLYLNESYRAAPLEPEPPVEFGSPAYQAMIARSLLHTGNTKRLKAAIDKARRGEEVTLAYIGGSLTQGAGAVPLHSQCYAYRSCERFRQLYGGAGGDSIRLVKAGVGGTSSELGVVRYERDVLREGAVQPDIVVIEFAVNDADDETRGACFESLVLKALHAANRPAVILLFSVFIQDWNLQDRLAPVGWHYDLPMVSVKDAVVEQFYLTREKGQVVSKRQYFSDIYHPTNTGHAIMTDCLELLFDTVDRTVAHEQDVELDKPPLIGSEFSEVRLLDRRHAYPLATIEEGGFHETDLDLQLAELDDHAHGTPLFPYNWMHGDDANNSSFKLTLSCRSLIMLYKDSGSSAFGTAQITVDGELFKTADPHAINWTHCNAMLLLNEPTAREHTVEVCMQPGHENRRFTILGFGYVG